MHSRVPFVAVLAALVPFLVPSPGIKAAEKTAAQLLPPTTVAYFELSDPPQLLDAALEHPLRERIESLEDVQKGLNSLQFKTFKFVVAMVEGQLGMKWREAVDALTDGGIHFGFDAETEGVAILVRSRDEPSLTKIRETFLQLARDDAKNKGKPDPIETSEYRGLTAYKIDDGIMAQAGSWLLFTNKGELAKAVADRVLDEHTDSLATDQNYQQARQTMTGQPSGWGYVNIATLRDAGVARELFREKQDNPGAELLLGGIASTLGKTPYATLELQVDEQHIRLAAHTPHDAGWVPAQREYFFGKQSRGTAPVPFVPRQTLMSIGSFRELGRFWLAKEDLFVDKAVAQLAQADSQFSTLFSGLDFGQDVLGALRPQSQFVLARQSFTDQDTPTPDIKLPAGALIFRLNDAAKIQRRLKVSFQSVIGLTNFGLAQQGQPQFDLNTERIGKAQVVSAEYLPEGDAAEGLINYNFSPSVAFVDDWFIVSSTKFLARELSQLAAQRRDEQPGDKSVDHTSAALDLQVLEQVLEDNRDQLVAQNMLEKGHGKKAAEKEIGTLLSLLQAGKNASLRLRTSEETLTLEFQVNFVP